LVAAFVQSLVQADSSARIEIGAGPPDTEDVLLCPFQAADLTGLVVGFAVVGGDELGQSLHVAGVHNLFKVTADKPLVVGGRHGDASSQPRMDVNVAVSVRPFGSIAWDNAISLPSASRGRYGRPSSAN
jgi:hypothetical protein